MGVDQDTSRRPPEALRDHFKAQEGYPENMRRVLLRAIGRQLAAVDFLRSASFLTPHLTLGFAVTVSREAQTLLHGSRGLSFGDSKAQEEAFGREFVSDGHFTVQDSRLHRQLQGLHIQAQDAARFGHPGEEPERWEASLDELVGFLQRFEQYVLQTFTTPQERARRKRRRPVAYGVCAALLLGGLAWGYVVTRPSRSQVDPSRITQPGGIVGVYYNGKDFDKRVLSRVDRQINLHTNRSPARGVHRDNFSVRWEGYIYIPQTGTSYLCVESDDGGRVYLDKALLINDWTIHPRHKACKKVRLERGWFPIRVEYFELFGGALMRLFWGPNKKRLRVVPPKHLCCRE